MSRKKLIYIVSDIDKSLHFEWIAPYLNEHFKLSFILMGIPNSALKKFLIRQKIHVVAIPYKKQGGFDLGMV